MICFRLRNDFKPEKDDYGAQNLTANRQNPWKRACFRVNQDSHSIEMKEKPKDWKQRTPNRLRNHNVICRCFQCHAQGQVSAKLYTSDKRATIPFNTNTHPHFWNTIIMDAFRIIASNRELVKWDFCMTWKWIFTNLPVCYNYCQFVQTCKRN